MQTFKIYCNLKMQLEDMNRYAGLLLATAKGFGLWPRLFWPFFGHFYSPVVTLVTFSNNLSNFEKNKKKSKSKSKSNKLKQIWKSDVKKLEFLKSKKN